MEKEIQNIVAWLREKVEEAHVKGLIVGVSGGLDSAVVAHLIKRAYPGHSLGVIMPIQSKEEDVKDAYEVMEKSGMEYVTADLTSTHTTCMQTIIQSNHALENVSNDVMRMADANLRARLRMSTLYTYATLHNYLVVGTDNKSEYYTGYFTKYGDGGVDILPIVEYTKTEIWEMARVLGVPQGIIDKKPSADLWEGQTDEDEMGTSYTHIDAFLEGNKVPTEDAQIIQAMHRRTAHKRETPTKYTRQ